MLRAARENCLAALALASEFYAPGFCRRNALGLPLADVFPLALGHEGEDLQHQVGDEGAHEIFSGAGVQQRHINHADVHALFFC